MPSANANTTTNTYRCSLNSPEDIQDILDMCEECEVHEESVWDTIGVEDSVWTFESDLPLREVQKIIKWAGTQLALHTVQTAEEYTGVAVVPTHTCETCGVVHDTLERECLACTEVEVQWNENEDDE